MYKVSFYGKGPSFPMGKVQIRSMHDVGLHQGYYAASH